MDNYTLETDWLHPEVQFLRRDKKLTNGERLTTYAYDPINDSRYVAHTTVENFTESADGSTWVFDLNYALSENPHLESRDLVWGKASFTVNFDVPSAEAVWTSAKKSHSKKYDGPGDAQLTKDPVTTERDQIATTKRLRERDLKRNLDKIGQGSACVITGERSSAVLDACHIMEVKSDGLSHASNGFMLRTDLHRLFDRRMLHIDPSTGVVTIVGDDKTHPDLKAYRKLVQKVKVDPDVVLERVYESLIKRNARDV